MPELSVVIPRSSAAVLGLSATMLESSAPMSASIPVPGSSTSVLPSILVLPCLSSVLFLTLYSPKTPTPNLTAGRRKLDDTDSGWSGRSKRASLQELYSGRIKRAALEEAFLLKAPLFLLLFPFSDISKGKPNKTFINTRPLANNHAKKGIDLSFAVCGYPLAVKLNRSWQKELLERRLTYIIETILLVAAIF